MLQVDRPARFVSAGPATLPKPLLPGRVPVDKRHRALHSDQAPREPAKKYLNALQAAAKARVIRSKSAPDAQLDGVHSPSRRLGPPVLQARRDSGGCRA